MFIEYLSLRSRSRLINLVFLLGVGCFATLVQADMVYVADGGNKVNVIDTSNNKIVATIPVGIHPFCMLINQAGRYIYVTNSVSVGTVSVIDTYSNRVISTIVVGQQPACMAINPSGTRLYVTNWGSDNVSVVDTGTNKVVATVTVGQRPISMAINKSGTFAYVVNQTSGDISVIDMSNNNVVRTIPVGNHSVGASWDKKSVYLEISPDEKRIYVADYGSNTVSVIDTSTNIVIDTVNVGSYPVRLAFNTSGTRVYVTNSATYNPGVIGTVSVIDTSNNKVVNTITVGMKPTGVRVNSDDTLVYVTNETSDSVSIIDTSSNSVISTVHVGTYPRDIVIRNTTCKDPAKHAKYSIATGKVSIPFTDLPALKEDSPEATGGMAVFKNLRLQFVKDQDFKVVTTTVTPDTSKEPVGDPCHAVYTYATRTLKIPRVEVPSIISTFPAITEGKPINIYEVTLQHIETNPVDLGIVRIKDATLIETIQ